MTRLQTDLTCLGNNSALPTSCWAARWAALKRLERHGLVTRTIIPTTPIGVVYAITPLGHSLRDPFQALCTWALAHEEALAAAATAYDESRM